MPLDPQAKLLLDAMAAMGSKPFEAMSVPEARASLAQLQAMSPPPEDVARLEDRKLPGPTGDIPVRVYWPAGTGTRPILVYFHGGGWVIGDLESHDATCRSLANGAGCIVVAVDYRLAPEHRFPGAAEDCFAATRWVAANAAALGGDPRRVAVGGDSAGGNLAAVVSLMARDRGGPPLVFQLLVYPVTDATFDTRSYRENAEGYFLTAAGMRCFWDHYLPDKARRTNPYASPLRARSLRGLPPALVITAEYDPLRDEGEAYAARLREEGNTVTLKRYDGMVHGFFSMAAALTQGKTALDRACAAMRAAFGP